MQPECGPLCPMMSRALMGCDPGIHLLTSEAVCLGASVSRLPESKEKTTFCGGII